MGKRVDFSRVPDRSQNPDATTRTGPTISIDTSYVTGPGHSYFETAARRDGKTPAQCGQWVVVGHYPTRDMALAGHKRWADCIRANGLPSADVFGNSV